VFILKNNTFFRVLVRNLMDKHEVRFNQVMFWHEWDIFFKTFDVLFWVRGSWKVITGISIPIGLICDLRFTIGVFLVIGNSILIDVKISQNNFLVRVSASQGSGVNPSSEFSVLCITLCLYFEFFIISSSYRKSVLNFNQKFFSSFTIVKWFNNCRGNLIL